MSAIIRMVNRIRGAQDSRTSIKVSVEDRERLENCWKAFDTLRDI